MGWDKLEGQGAWSPLAMVTIYKKTPFVFEFSLCLSRACLGKTITFIYKWLKKTVFLPPSGVLYSMRRFVKPASNQECVSIAAFSSWLSRACLGKTSP